MERPNARLLIGMAGSIHSALIFTYLDELQERFAGEVAFVLTSSASQMVSVPALRACAPDRVFTDQWDSSPVVPMPLHIRLATWADAFVVLPASANLLGKAANGIADDLLTTLLISYQRPIVFAPAMNIAMWQSKPVQRNVQRLKEDGHLVVHADPGLDVQGGEVVQGVGPTPAIVLAALASLVAAGGTAQR
jgi:phosphopantothenoylcysteine decarboxylase / phosphopantothenate---cysteine ligase